MEDVALFPQAQDILHNAPPASNINHSPFSTVRDRAQISAWCIQVSRKRWPRDTVVGQRLGKTGKMNTTANSGRDESLSQDT